VRTGDFRLNPEHPPLVKLWVGLFLPERAFRLGPFRPLVDKNEERDFTEAAVFEVNDPDVVQRRTRIAMWLFHGLLLFALGLALTRLLGLAWAGGTLAFLAVDPTVAAHMPVVMTDLPIALLATLAMLATATAFRTWRAGPLLLASIALGLALGAKHSGVVAAGAVAVFGVVSAFRGQREGARRGDLPRRLGLVATVLGGAVLTLWGLYGLRFHASPDGGDPFNRPMADKITDVRSPAWRSVLSVADKAHVLPRPYLWGLADTVRAGVEGPRPEAVCLRKHLRRGTSPPTTPWAFCS
jgi:hypothetical protein